MREKIYFSEYYDKNKEKIQTYSRDQYHRKKGSAKPAAIRIVRESRTLRFD